LASVISISRSSHQDHVAFSGWAPSLPESSLRQSVRWAAPHQSALESQADQLQPLFAKNAGHDRHHVAMHR
jgi:hypothetical protein